jgi:hypothetical protein
MGSTGVVLVERVEWDTSSYCIMSIIAAGQPCGLAGSVSGVQPQALAQVQRVRRTPGRLGWRIEAKPTKLFLQSLFVCSSFHVLQYNR